LSKVKNTIFINGRFLTQKPTGIQRFSYEICKSLLKEGVNIIVLAPKKIRSEYKLDCKIIKFGLLSGVLWEHICLLLYLLKFKNPLLVNFGSPGPLFYKNRIVTIHDISFKTNPKWFVWYYSLYYRFITPIFARRSKKIITVSEFSKSEIQKWLNIPDEKFTIIHNAVSKSIFCSDKDCQEVQENYILSVSSLDPRKNIDSIYKAFEKYNSKDIKLILVGISSPMFNFKQSEDVKINSIGYVTDTKLAELYKNAKAFVYLSVYEGFGIPPLEAMSFGCPVILSDIPVFREIFGNAACYVDPYNINSVVKGLQRVLTNSEYRNKLVNHGFEKAKEYSWKKSAEKLCKEFSQV
jgi:glycosyltransferase involved in cell wall biosynthesis